MIETYVINNRKFTIKELYNLYYIDLKTLKNTDISVLKHYVSLKVYL